jgi:hypothetical protein
VPGLRDAGQGAARFDPPPDAAAYEYRVGSGPFRPLPGAGTFRPAGLDFGPNDVTVRATDAAGNLGPEAAVVVTLARPRGVWFGQQNREDLAGPWNNRTGPDGIADIRITLLDLPTDREITFVEINSHGAGRWQYGNPLNHHWQVALVRPLGAAYAHLYFQPFRVEIAKEYHVQLQFSDGTSSEFYMGGGRVDPRLRARPVGRGGVGDPAPASSRRQADRPLRRVPVGPRLAAILAARAARRDRAT